MTSKPTLGPDAAQQLQTLLNSFAERMPGVFLHVGTTDDEVLFAGQAGRFDMLQAGREVDENTIYWFASTTKLLTSVATLQLIERGVLNYDTPLSKYFPQLKTPFKIIAALEDGNPVLEDCDTEITVATLLNQTSGFGEEFGDKVQAWKRHSDVGKGFTNSCKKANLVHVPPTEVPGTKFQYGNGSEWTGLMIQEATGQDLDDYLRDNVCRPLGMSSTTFYPFSSEQSPDLMPLRWHSSSGEPDWAELTNQQDGLKLPRTREEIEYPVAGGGIYTRPADYHKLLRHLLHHYLAATPSPELALSAATIKTLFEPSLPEGAHAGWSEGLLSKYVVSERTELDWSTGMSILQCKGQQRGRWGRSRGSAGWLGAPGIDYWIDPTKRVAVVLGTQLLPVGDALVQEFTIAAETLLYKLLQ